MEHVFRASGIYHNAQRNRLGHRKALKMVHVKTDLLSKDPIPLRMKGLSMTAMTRKKLRKMRMTMKRRKMIVKSMIVIQV